MASLLQVTLEETRDSLRPCSLRLALDFSQPREKLLCVFCAYKIVFLKSTSWEDLMRYEFEAAWNRLKPRQLRPRQASGMRGVRYTQRAAMWRHSTPH